MRLVEDGGIVMDKADGVMYQRRRQELRAWSTLRATPDGMAARCMCMCTFVRSRYIGTLVL
jgi:hypothetical protein